MTTADEIRLIVAINTVVREAGARGLPAGYVYAAVADRVSLGDFAALVERLVAARVFERHAAHLVYVGPDLGLTIAELEFTRRNMVRAAAAASRAGDTAEARRIRAEVQRIDARLADLEADESAAEVFA